MTTLISLLSIDLGSGSRYDRIRIISASDPAGGCGIDGTSAMALLFPYVNFAYLFPDFGGTSTAMTYSQLNPNPEEFKAIEGGKIQRFCLQQTIRTLRNHDFVSEIP